MNLNHPILRNSIGMLLGIIVGGMVNMTLIMNSSKLIPPPIGTNLTTEAGLIAAMPLMQPIHFLMPFLAHAIGTLVGAFIVTAIAISRQKTLALIIGLQFFIGGAMMVYKLPSPIWFNLTDLILAYFPFALLGYWLCKKINSSFINVK